VVFLSIMNILRVKRKALELLDRVETDNSYLHLLLQKEADTARGAPEEYPVLVQLVRGVLEHRAELDETLSPFLPRGIDSLPSPIRQLLRLGAYQILFLERVKKRDVVFEAVELTKGGAFKGFSKLVNAVLRKIEPTIHGNERSGGATLNFPAWLIERWTEQFGREEVNSFCEVSNKPLPLYLRVNNLRVDRRELQRELKREGVVTEPAAFSSNSLRVEVLPKDKRLTQFEAFRRGAFFVQDLSSTIVADIVSADRPSAVCDVCAAPGGKACSIALSIGPFGGVVRAFDHTERRAGLIEDAVTRLDLPNVSVGVRDAVSVPDSERGQYDAVLLDAPCSGFGTLGRKIDVRWSKSEETIRELTGVQERLMSAAAALVKPGGVIVYSTCTIERAENEDIIESFLRTRSDFYVENLSSTLSAELCTPDGFYRAWPHRHHMAGAFAAKLRKQMAR
jgi:16S rRNA (cytosine967-C5)-methyltransferase